MVGTYPPTHCGIATFTASLRRALAAGAPDGRFGVVAAVDEEPPGPFSGEVVAHLLPGSQASRRAVVEALQQFDVVIVQHEFGIYGGNDGADILDLAESLDQPLLVVLHTVLGEPTPSQRTIVEKLARRASRLVVQSESAQTRLLEHYEVDAGTVRVIPHGARNNLTPAASREDGEAPTVLTWGLLGRDKGVELGIEAIAQLADLRPAPRYVIVGQTHPRVRARYGEEYRESLAALATQLGIDRLVEFDDRYHDTRSLLERVREADVVLLPYRSREQVVSGVLVEAIASGKPIVATHFPHAEELLRAGSGVLVPHDDPDAIASALRRLVTEPGAASRAAAVARAQAQDLFWPAVAKRYLALADEVATRRAATPDVLPPPSFKHLLRLSDSLGVFEHAKLIVPRREHGYCTDDVARALVALMREPVRPPQLERLVEICLAFLERAQIADGRFRNRLSTDGRFAADIGSDDATGRALWATGLAATAATDPRQRARALALFTAGVRFSSRWPRANAYAVLGAAELLAVHPRPAATAAYELLERAMDGLGSVAADTAWPWPEPRLTYANAVLAEARIAAGSVVDDEVVLNEGLELLAWLVATETDGDHFSFTPVGGWTPGEPRPAFDQQPIEAAAMADACARAYEVTGESEWVDHALRAAAWFTGANDVGVPLFDEQTGGSHDGLTPTGVNANEGAESTLALITTLQHARRLRGARRPAAAGVAAARR